MRKGKQNRMIAAIVIAIACMAVGFSVLALQNSSESALYGQQGQEASDAPQEGSTDFVGEAKEIADGTDAAGESADRADTEDRAESADCAEAEDRAGAEDRTGAQDGWTDSNEEIIYHADGSYWVREYGTGGDVVKDTYHRGDGTIVAYSVYEFEENGTGLKVKDYYADVLISVHEYGPSGNCIRSTYYHADGTLGSVEEYDADGTVISVTHYGEDGLPLNLTEQSCSGRKETIGNSAIGNGANILDEKGKVLYNQHKAYIL